MAVAAQKGEAHTVAITPANFPSGKTEFVIAFNRRSARVSASAAADDRSALSGRASASPGISARRLQKGKIAGVAANALISLETAKEKVWKSLEKAWKSLEFPWKSLHFPWKGLEKFGPVGPAAAIPSWPRSWRAAA